MKLIERIDKILKDKYFIDSMNEMMLRWSVKELISSKTTFNWKPTVAKYNESKYGESPYDDGKVRYIKYTNRWESKELKARYRVYNDKSWGFSNPQIRKIYQLNDPIDTIWLHKYISHTTFVFLRSLMNNKICASYMAPANIEELYMVSNYSRGKQRFIEFDIKDVIDFNSKNNHYMGLVLYPSQKNFNIILRKIKESLKINSLHGKEENQGDLAIYYAIEIVISCFVKEFSMRKENEFRTITFDNFDFKDIPILTKKDKLKFSALDNMNDYYQKVSDIKDII